MRNSHVVIVGGGFGGLTAAQALKRARVRVTLVDRTNHHLFQPLLYQVAMAGLSPAEIACPIRSVLRHQKNVTVLLASVSSIELNDRTVRFEDPTLAELSYDYLILATGARTNYFGRAEWEQFAVGLKSLDDAVEIRRRVLLAFEAAERTTDPDERLRLLTFVVIGGGPTGVELAGAIAELARVVLARDFRSINTKATRILLVEGGERILSSFSEDVSASAERQLRDLTVTVRTKALVTEIDAAGVHLGAELIPTATVLWAAGVRATPLTEHLGVPLDRIGRILVEPDCSLPGHREAFAIGDVAAFLHQDGKPLPGVSPVAMQQARFVAKAIGHDGPRTKFVYWDKGSMATIGRSAAVAEMGRLHLSGFIAWVAWLGVHLFFLIGFRNRFVVLFSWAWSYFTYQRGARLITGGRMNAGAPCLDDGMHEDTKTQRHED